MKQTYQEASETLAQAIDIAIDAIRTFPPAAFQPSHVEQFLKTYGTMKEQCLHPQPAFAKLSSLNYIEADVFTFYRESSGPAVDYFWSQIRASGLPYIKETILNQVLQRNKIKSQIEFDQVTDMMTTAFQNGSITETQWKALSTLLSEFEQA